MLEYMQSISNILLMWYQLPLEKVFQQLKGDSTFGLTDAEVRKRTKIYGLNVLPRGKESRWWQFFFRQFKSPLVYILLIGAFLTLWLGAFIDMTVILLAVAINVSVGFWQEFRSSAILKKLREIIQVHALVIRKGKVHEISAKNLVPGDIILLKAGRKIPADARIVSARNLKINESILTGESSPIEKQEAIIREKATVGDRTNMVHAGTVITRGEGTAIVVATGSETEFGKIALLTQKSQDRPTPLQTRIGRLGKIITAFVGISTIVIFVVGILENHSFREMITTAIAVAVAAIPEGLPAAISIILAVSAQRILGKKGVVKNLLAAETLGGASVICADKTGTLTEGIMSVEELIVAGNQDRAHTILALANEAVVESVNDKFSIKGDTTDQAKMQEFLRAGGNLQELNEQYPRIDLLPFDPALKYIASRHRTAKARFGEVTARHRLAKGNQDDEQVLFVSGAPEVLLHLSNQVIIRLSIIAV